MAALTAGTKFPTTLVTEMFDKTKGHSALARLSGQTPISFAGNTVFVFSVDGEASVVGEGGAKPAGSTTINTVEIRPLKVVYQSRVTDEFLKCSDEKRLEHLRNHAEGFAKKIGRAIDIIGIHGLDPASKQPIAALATKCFDGAVTNKETYNADAPDDNLDNATALIRDNDGTVTGMALAPAFGSAMGKMKANGTTGVYLYPEYRFGGNPERFAGLRSDVNNTVSFNNSDDMAIIGDFENAFKWGFAEDVTFEVIEYGDPDGAGRDLKRYNEVLLRSEAYIGFGILDADAFAIVEGGTVSA